ncbi:MAG: hypothetical protein IT223_09090 [Crocinitomicaceae bacterium]|nr:hypothetical protein [Crocinitomicaceae bacterium]
MVQGVVSNNPQDRRQLTNLFSARQQLRPAGELSTDLFNTVSTQMSKQIGIQIKQIVQ